MAASLFAGFLFGTIGVAVFIYGKKQSSFKSMLIGGLLVAYPYFVQNTIALYVIGSVLLLALYFWRE
jgi:hypothetical protein